MCDCDDYFPEFFTEVTRTSRRDRKCRECRRVIRKGERYDAISGKWDGHIDSFGRCEHCSASLEIINAEINTKTNPWCFCFGEMWESVDETASGWHKVSDYVAGLLVSAKLKWSVDGKLMPVPKVLERTNA